MANKSRKRRSSSRLYETEPNTKQIRLPVPKRTMRDKPPVWSAPSKYQQTITQMNPFYTIFHPDSEDEDLEYDEEETQNYVASPVGRKRRKIEASESPPFRKVETRSSARKAVKAEPVSNEKKPRQKPVYGKPKRALVTFQTPTELMPPPKTPQTVRKREIPSSQSPADSPLSTQKRTPARDYARSPLKERSTNRIIATPTSKTAPRWAKKLEVADSYENDDKESSATTPSTTTKKDRFMSISSPGFAPGEISQLVQIGPGVEEVQESSLVRKTDSQKTGRIRPDMILDTDVEDDDNENDEAESDIDLTPPTCIEDQNPPKTSDKEYALPSNEAKESKHEFGTNKKHQSDGRTSIKTDREGLLTPNDPRSDSREASAQLHNDLYRVTGPGGLQTESQYENAWASYHPAPISIPSSPLEILSSAPHELSDPAPKTSPIEIPSSAPHERSDPASNTVPTQILSPSATTFKRPPATPFKRRQPVPPSQATTTDATQSSPRKMPSSSSLAMPSSPPPMPPSMSSSSPNRGLDPWACHEWNGVRLTDSQLLPESLLNDSVGGPPGGWHFGEDDLGEE